MADSDSTGQIGRIRPPIAKPVMSMKATHQGMSPSLSMRNDSAYSLKAEIVTVGGTNVHRIGEGSHL